ncbi:MAG: competence/damage-inducible protein A [Desulfatiglandales bacterium]
MYGEIITVGNELVSGRTLDLNAWYAAGRLTASGLKVTRITTVGDDPDRMSKALTEAIRCSRFVIITGGLGSTEDDITCRTVADALNRPLCLDEKMFRQIQVYVKARGIALSPALEKMAWMPEGSRILNPNGNFCGFSLSEDRVRLYFLPGVPEQMRFLMDKFVIPEILSQYETLPVLRQRILKLYGINEPRIADILKELLSHTHDVILGFYPHFPENHITLGLRGKDEPTVTLQLDEMEREICKILGPHVFCSGNQTMEEVVGGMLREQNLSIAVAESCTGGLIGNLLTNVPGSSSYFKGGVMVYSNEAKVDLINVSPETIAGFGAVSNETAREMARGVRERMKTDLGLAVTGIAGPDGGTREKPVGTVHISLARGEKLFAQKYRFWGTRSQIKQNSAMMALDWVRRYLDGNPFLSSI